jgi:hypothetical protein
MTDSVLCGLFDMVWVGVFDRRRLTFNDVLVLPCKNHYLKVYIFNRDSERIPRGLPRGGFNWRCCFYGLNNSNVFAACHVNGVPHAIINCIFN